MQDDYFFDKILNFVYLVKICIDQTNEYSTPTERSTHQKTSRNR